MKVLTLVLLILWAFMSVAWLVRYLTKKSGWIDAIWSLSIGVGGVIAAWGEISVVDASIRQIIVGFCVLLASLRLGISIAKRTIKSGDDPRYAYLENQWGSNRKFRLYIFVQIQAACGFILCLTVYLSANNPASFDRLWDWVFLVIIGVAIVGEAIADWQLSTFKNRDLKVGICDIGLWGLSRHPNYFFQWLYWLGIACLAIRFDGEGIVGYLALIGPIMIYWLLIKISGIPPLEKHMVETRKQAYIDYQLRVPAFFLDMNKIQALLTKK